MTKLRILKGLLKRAARLLPMLVYRRQFRRPNSSLPRVCESVWVELVPSAEISFCTFGVCPKSLNGLVFLSKPKVSHLNSYGSYIVLFNGFSAKPAAEFCHLSFPESLGVTGRQYRPLQPKRYWYKEKLSVGARAA
jgi:hypothetical protein